MGEGPVAGAAGRGVEDGEEGGGAGGARDFLGDEGICLGRSADGLWAISPDGSDEILSLVFEKDFGLLADLSSDPTRN